MALVVFASWRPGKALLGALLLAFFDALQLRLHQSGNAVLPYQLYLMLPYFFRYWRWCWWPARQAIRRH